jgi:hypothetical protein
MSLGQRIHNYWSSVQTFFKIYWKPLAIVGATTGAIIVGVYFGVDTKALALFALIVGFIANGFAALATVTGLIPIIGPILVKLLSLPLFYLLNSIGYLISLLAVRKGYGHEVANSRLMTVILLVGIVLGYIIGNLMPMG